LDFLSSFVSLGPPIFLVASLVADVSPAVIAAQ
jgi:hypothetical protein